MICLLVICMTAQVKSHAHTSYDVVCVKSLRDLMNRTASTLLRRLDATPVASTCLVGVHTSIHEAEVSHEDRTINRHTLIYPPDANRQSQVD